MFLRIHYTEKCGIDLMPRHKADITGTLTMDIIEKWVQDAKGDFGLEGPPDRWDVYDGVPDKPGNLLRRWVRRSDTDIKEITLRNP